MSGASASSPALRRAGAGRTARVQAATVRMREEFVRERFGHEGRARLRSAVSPELRTLLENPDPRGGWVPFELFVESNVVADRLFGRGDLALSWEMGRFAASHNLGVWKSFVYKRVPPSVLMSLAAGLWSHHYDGGRLATRTAGNGLIVSIVDFPTPHRTHCLSISGWLLGTLEQGPRRNIVVQELSCRVEGGSSCDFRVGWE